jgi:hypothetical protein
MKKKSLQHKRIILLLVTGYWLLVTLTGCGYTTRSLISNKYKTIYIPPFLNQINITSEAKTGSKYQIYRPGLETDLTKAVIDRFRLDGNLRLEKEANADLVLKGSLVDYRRDVLRYATDDNPEEYRVSIMVDISLRDTKEDRIVWEEQSFTGDTTYFLSGTNAKSDATAITEATKDIARRIVARTVENW